MAAKEYTIKVNVQAGEGKKIVAALGKDIAKLQENQIILTLNSDGVIKNLYEISQELQKVNGLSPEIELKINEQLLEQSNKMLTELKENIDSIDPKAIFNRMKELAKTINYNSENNKEYKEEAQELYYLSNAYEKAGNSKKGYEKAGINEALANAKIYKDLETNITKQEKEIRDLENNIQIFKQNIKNLGGSIGVEEIEKATRDLDDTVQRLSALLKEIGEKLNFDFTEQLEKLSSSINETLDLTSLNQWKTKFVESLTEIGDTFDRIFGNNSISKIINEWVSADFFEYYGNNKKVPERAMYFSTKKNIHSNSHAVGEVGRVPGNVSEYLYAAIDDEAKKYIDAYIHSHSEQRHATPSLVNKNGSGDLLSFLNKYFTKNIKTQLVRGLEEIFIFDMEKFVKDNNITEADFNNKDYLNALKDAMRKAETDFQDYYKNNIEKINADYYHHLVSDKRFDIGSALDSLDKFKGSNQIYDELINTIQINKSRFIDNIVNSTGNNLEDLLKNAYEKTTGNKLDSSRSEILYRMINQVSEETDEFLISETERKLWARQQQLAKRLSTKTKDFKGYNLKPEHYQIMSIEDFKNNNPYDFRDNSFEDYFNSFEKALRRQAENLKKISSNIDTYMDDIGRSIIEKTDNAVTESIKRLDDYQQKLLEISSGENNPPISQPPVAEEPIESNTQKLEKQKEAVKGVLVELQKLAKIEKSGKSWLLPEYYNGVLQDHYGGQIRKNSTTKKSIQDLINRYNREKEQYPDEEKWIGYTLDDLIKYVSAYKSLEEAEEIFGKKNKELWEQVVEGIKKAEAAKDAFDDYYLVKDGLFNQLNVDSMKLKDLDQVKKYLLDDNIESALNLLIDKYSEFKEVANKTNVLSENDVSKITHAMQELTSATSKNIDEFDDYDKCKAQVEALAIALNNIKTLDPENKSKLIDPKEIEKAKNQFNELANKMRDFSANNFKTSAEGILRDLGLSDDILNKARVKIDGLFNDIKSGTIEGDSALGRFKTSLRELTGGDKLKIDIEANVDPDQFIQDIETKVKGKKIKVEVEGNISSVSEFLDELSKQLGGERLSVETSGNSVKFVNGEDGALDNLRQKLDRIIQLIKDKTSEFEKESLVVKKVMGEEVHDVWDLETKIREVIKAISDKTSAFREEPNAVRESVNAEKIILQELVNILQEIIDKIGDINKSKIDIKISKEKEIKKSSTPKEKSPTKDTSSNTKSLEREALRINKEIVKTEQDLQVLRNDKSKSHKKELEFLKQYRKELEKRYSNKIEEFRKNEDFDEDAFNKKKTEQEEDLRSKFERKDSAYRDERYNKAYKERLKIAELIYKKEAQIEDMESSGGYDDEIAAQKELLEILKAKEKRLQSIMSYYSDGDKSKDTSFKNEKSKLQSEWQKGIDSRRAAKQDKEDRAGAAAYDAEQIKIAEEAQKRINEERNKAIKINSELAKIEREIYDLEEHGKTSEAEAKRNTELKRSQEQLDNSLSNIRDNDYLTALEVENSLLEERSRLLSEHKQKSQAKSDDADRVATLNKQYELAENIRKVRSDIRKLEAEGSHDRELSDKYQELNLLRNEYKINQDIIDSYGDQIDRQEYLNRLKKEATDFAEKERKIANIKADKEDVVQGKQRERDATDENNKIAKKYKDATKDLAEYFELREKFINVDNDYSPGSDNKNAWERYKKLRIEVEKLAEATYELNKAGSKASQNKVADAWQKFVNAYNAFDAGNIGKQFDKLNNAFGKLKIDENGNISNKFTGDYNRLKELLGELEDFKYIDGPLNSKQIADSKELIEEIVALLAKSKDYKLYDETQIVKLQQRITKFQKDNSAMGRKFNADFEALLKTTKDWGNEVDAISFKKVLNEVIKLETQVVHLGKTGKNLFDMIRERATGISAQFFAQYFSWQDWIRYAREAFQTIRELDTALVDLRKTTTMSDSELKEFYFDANDVAKQMGVTTKEIIDQASAWSRLNKIGPLYSDI